MGPPLSKATYPAALAQVSAQLEGEGTPRAREVRAEASPAGRAIPKDIRSGADDEWGAVIRYRDELDRLEHFQECRAEKEKQRIYRLADRDENAHREELDAQTQYRTLQKSFDARMQADADLSLLRAQCDAGLLDYEQERAETETKRRMYDRSLAAETDLRRHAAEQQRAKATADGIKMRQTMERAIREAEERELAQKARRKDVLAMIYNEQKKVRDVNERHTGRSESSENRTRSSMRRRFTRSSTHSRQDRHASRPSYSRKRNADASSKAH